MRAVIGRKLYGIGWPGAIGCRIHAKKQDCADVLFQRLLQPNQCRVIPGASWDRLSCRSVRPAWRAVSPSVGECAATAGAGYPKKSRDLLREGGIPKRFAFIDTEKASCPVSRMYHVPHRRTAPNVPGAGKSVVDLWQSAGDIIAAAEKVGKIDADVALGLKVPVDAQLATLDRNAETVRAV